MTNELRSRVQRQIALVAALVASDRVQRLASQGPCHDPLDLASEAADGILDIEAASRKLAVELLPRIEALDPRTQEYEDLLGDIGEEYRHIYYHIVHMRLFDYVLSKP